jgi:uncharacterized protein YjdB
MKKSVLFTLFAALVACTPQDAVTEDPTIKVESIEFDKGDMTLHVSETATLSVDITPFNAENQTIKWSCSNPEILHLNVGYHNFGEPVSTKAEIIALEVGETTITAESEDGGHIATCNVTVPSARVEYIKFQNKEYKVTVNDEDKCDANLVIEFTPKWATNKNLKVTSSNPEIISVYDDIEIRGFMNNDYDYYYGWALVKVHGIANGQATITAVSEDRSLVASCTVIGQSKATFGAPAVIR